MAYNKIRCTRNRRYVQLERTQSGFTSAELVRFHPPEILLRESLRSLEGPLYPSLYLVDGCLHTYKTNELAHLATLDGDALLVGQSSTPTPGLRTTLGWSLWTDAIPFCGGKEVRPPFAIGRWVALSSAVVNTLPLEMFFVPVHAGWVLKRPQPWGGLVIVMGYTI